MLRHFLGQTSTQALQVQQRRRSMFHSFSRLRDDDGVRGTALGAGTAEDARLDVDLDMSPARMLRVMRLLYPRRIEPRGGTGEEIAKRYARHPEDRHGYLSVQLMQGSMVRTSTGTSASSQPWQHLHQRGDVGERRRAHPVALQVAGPVRPSRSGSPRRAAARSASGTRRPDTRDTFTPTSPRGIFAATCLMMSTDWKSSRMRTAQRA